jgi:hypothetical protein
MSDADTVLEKAIRDEERLISAFECSLAAFSKWKGQMETAAGQQMQEAMQSDFVRSLNGMRILCATLKTRRKS